MRAGGADKERALAVLDWALFRILKLLHPFMPFVTEELAHRMGLLKEGEFLMYQALPVCENRPFDADAAQAEAKFELVKGGRFLRSSYNIPDGRKLKFHIKAADAAALKGLESELDSLKLLLNAESIDLSLESFDSAKLGAAPSKLCQAGVVSLPLAGLIDVEAERAKLKKELADIEKWIAGTAGKLKNERFVANAPEQVVANARAQLADLEAKKQRTEELLAALG